MLQNTICCRLFTAHHVAGPGLQRGVQRVGGLVLIGTPGGGGRLDAVRVSPEDRLRLVNIDAGG
jgi:hypothetical protein